MRTFILEQASNWFRQTKLNCTTAADDFQPWQFGPFNSSISRSLELVFQGHDCLINQGETQPPFFQLSQRYYALKLDTPLAISQGLDLQIRTHHHFYQDFLGPCALPVTYAVDWASVPLIILFRYTQTINVIQGMPLAEVIVTPHANTLVSEMSSESADAYCYRRKILDNLGIKPTRTLRLDNFELDNLYELLSHQVEKSKINLLPAKPLLFGRHS